MMWASVRARRQLPLVGVLFASIAFGPIGCAGPGASKREPPRVTAQEPAASATLETRVKVALVDARNVDGAALFVEARDGKVRLSGFTDSDAQRLRAIDTARAVDGVRSVESRIQVR